MAAQRPDPAVVQQNLLTFFEDSSLQLGLISQLVKTWRDKIDGRLLYSWCAMICRIKIMQPTFEDRLLVCPAGDIDAAILVMLHYPVTKTSRSRHYQNTLDLRHICIRTVNGKLNLSECLLMDIVPFCIQRRPTETRPYIRIFHETPANLAEFDRFTRGLLEISTARVVLTCGTEPSKKLQR
ncbi:hypothetical protein M409DRAFT_25075 [Zasmidium cellare ATCC 36951]|uniref:Uncharacterized protein n=1 Tax=Zasmidium cellare ATCC 36951 TaxID=1080233 RepID=A0A6A6CCC2_ZASCE|nr:uncharacterized protein M409DRAFT_25075 [Zasmidium cellare ATCC 36951]KAF2164681.1 hypothetical protein M409DRAFT_25075 [Zasmidium cellare ATCC 36951]